MDHLTKRHWTNVKELLCSATNSELYEKVEGWEELIASELDRFRAMDIAGLTANNINFDLGPEYTSLPCSDRKAKFGSIKLTLLYDTPAPIHKTLEDLTEISNKTGLEFARKGMLSERKSILNSTINPWGVWWFQETEYTRPHDLEIELRIGFSFTCYNEEQARKLFEEVKSHPKLNEKALDCRYTNDCDGFALHFSKRGFQEPSEIILLECKNIANEVLEKTTLRKYYESEQHRFSTCCRVQLDGSNLLVNLDYYGKK